MGLLFGLFTDFECFINGFLVALICLCFYFFKLLLILPITCSIGVGNIFLGLQIGMICHPSLGLDLVKRFLRLGYLMNRVGALVPPVGRPAEWLVTQFGLRAVAVPVNLGDLFTVYARKPLVEA